MGVTPESPQLVRDALARLGVRRLVLSVHDASFPADPGEDTGRGSPYTASGHAFLRWVRDLGFDGVQMGPQGQTTLANPSPYDGALFSREVMNLALLPLALDPSWGHVLSPARVSALAATSPPLAATRVHHRHAFLARHAALREAFLAFRAGTSAALRRRQHELASWGRDNAWWLEADGLYEALSHLHGVDDWRAWPFLDGRLLVPRRGEEEACRLRIAEVRQKYGSALDLHTFGQFVLHTQHSELRRFASEIGLRLYGDLQVGVSHRDRWSRRGLFLHDYVMGAPPSRTNPEGQPWGYPVLDPDLYFESDGSPGPAQRFVAARLDRLLGDFDGVRVDHPHGLVTPWVYRSDDPDPHGAVRKGARLFSSPDLPDHPRLARYAIARPDQIDHALPRHADHRVHALEPAQVERYGVLLDVALSQARRHGRELSDVLCEVLSTWPAPLRAVMERHGLGRFYVTQKADPGDRQDVYRTANAQPEDWVMVGSHDTASIWALLREWEGTERTTAWARYLAGRLTPPGRDPSAVAERLASSRGALADAMLADLFVGPARHVSVFFADLLGLEERYNLPGTVGGHNWTLRVPPDFAAFHAIRSGDGAALCPARSLALALRARGDDDADALAARLSPAG